MPLEIQVTRNGKAVPFVWDYTTLSCILSAVLKESDPEMKYSDEGTFGELPEGKYVDFRWAPIYYLNTKSPLWHRGSYTIRTHHLFDVVSDKKPIELKPDDEVTMYRSHK